MFSLNLSDDLFLDNVVKKCSLCINVIRKRGREKENVKKWKQKKKQQEKNKKEKQRGQNRNDQQYKWLKKPTR